jgi:hypothetical protein
MLLSACNGLFADLYDEAPATSTAEYGFTEEATATTVGRIYVDATSYTRWTYLNFRALSMDTLDVTQPAPAEWDLALHRYDAKTNGGAVAETSARDFSELATASVGEYRTDTWTTAKVVTDMSHMMDGYLSYVPSDYNETLSTWLNVDTSSMPPSYTLSGRIYIIRLADGTRAAVRLTNFMNAASVKGYMTLEYQYPLE